MTWVWIALGWAILIAMVAPIVGRGAALGGDYEDIDKDWP